MKMQVEMQLRIRKNKVFIGKGVKMILDAIDEHKSIKKACEFTGLSYPKALRMLKTIESELGFAIVASEKGGRHHGGTSLTEKGRAVLECYREIENETKEFAQKLVQTRFVF